MLNPWYPEKKEGIITEPTVRELQKVHAEIKFDTTGHRRHEGDLKQELANRLSSQLIKDGFIRFEHRRSENQFRDSLSASVLCVKSSKLTHFAIEEEVFRYNNQNWSEDDIKIALKETFPERFI